jgi:cyclic di-GMP phosphodiesterase
MSIPMGFTLPKILIVDDDPSILALLKLALRNLASRITEARSAPAALEAIESGDHDIALVDIYMPGCSGLELLATARQSQWDMGFILITGEVRVELVMEALRLGASDFLVKPFTFQELADAMDRTFRRLLLERESRAYRGSLETAIQRRSNDLEKALRELEANYRTTLEALSLALDSREHETYAHSLRVRAYTVYLARAIGYPPALLPSLEQAALLHDIGKLAVPDSVLLKPGSLTEDEWELMRAHAQFGAQILGRIPFLKSAALIVRHHHERYDGTGYPDRLRGDRIPIGARIFGFADTLDAMTSDRPYRKAPGFGAVLDEISRHMGTQFDPHIASLFLKVPIEDWQRLRKRVDEIEASETQVANGDPKHSIAVA